MGIGIPVCLRRHSRLATAGAPCPEQDGEAAVSARCADEPPSLVVREVHGHAQTISAEGGRIVSTEKLIDRVMRSIVLEAAAVEHLSSIDNDHTGTFEGPRATGAMEGR